MASSDGARSGALLATAHTLAIDGSTGQVVDALRHASVEAILLKGPALASWLYDDGCPRYYGDADLLVPVQKLAAAERTLRELGFKPIPSEMLLLGPDEHADPWVHEDGLEIDLHRTLFAAGVPPEELWTVLWQSTETMSVGGIAVPVLTEPARALVVAVHAAQHGPASQKPLEDLRRATTRVDERTWELAAELAGKLELAPTFARGLRLDPAGMALAERLDLFDSELIELAEREGSRAPLAIGFERLTQATGPAAKVALLRRELLPRPAYLRWWTPMARRGTVGLGAAYLWRVGWLLWHAPPSLVAWRRARRPGADPAEQRQPQRRARGRPPVLYVIQQQDYSGAELMQVPIMLADRDPLLACPLGSRTEELAREHGIETVPLPFRSMRHSGGRIETLRSLGRGARSALELRRLLRQHPERRIVYATSLRPGLLAGVAAMGLGRRVVWSVTDFMPPPPLRGLTRLIARYGCARAVALSRAVAQDFSGSSRALARRTTVVYPGTDPARFRPERTRPGAPRAVILGHVSPVKCTELALDVAARVGAEIADFELEILGRAQFREEDFAYERRLKQRVASDPRLAQHVRFSGYTSDVATELGRFGLLFHSRPDEPFGIALVEGMAAGLPVVAPGSAGPAEIVEHGVSGLLFAPGDADEAAAHVLALLRDPELAARMGAAARTAVERRFAISLQVEATQYVLDDVAARLDAYRAAS